MVMYATDKPHDFPAVTSKTKGIKAREEMKQGNQEVFSQIKKKGGMLLPLKSKNSNLEKKS